MQWPLVLSGLAMGLAAVPHCAVMCSAPCAALTQDRRADMAVFQLGRLLSYGAVGALSAYSVATFGGWSQAVPVLRPLWTLLHLAFLSLGLWWLVTGQHPAWMRRESRASVSVMSGRPRALRSGLAGLAWVAWPCAALQAALLLAALGNHAAVGALVMLAFALASMPGLLLAPWALRRWRAWRGVASVGASDLSSTAFRVAGAALAMTSVWALTHDLWHGIWIWCTT